MLKDRRSGYRPEVRSPDGLKVNIARRVLSMSRLAIRNARAAVAFWASLGVFALVAACDLAAPRLDSDQAVTGLMGSGAVTEVLPSCYQV